ncbi:MAG: response regulator [Verrucomicrobia bacterium]|nr:response regulator [Verrucomicrobiota bacterium]
MEQIIEGGAKFGVPEKDPTEGASVLAVDDEPISRKAVVAGLEKAGLQAVSLGDPLSAYNNLGAGATFDLIILDVDMPRMNGYELCVKLRALPAHAKTPVVFVTSLSDFQSSARSAISGGNDLIAKPILPIELAVKAIMYVMKSRLGLASKSV